MMLQQMREKLQAKMPPGLKRWLDADISKLLEPWMSAKQPIVVGIDVSANSVKLLELRKSGQQIRVESFAVAPLSADAVIERTIKDVNAVAEAVAVLTQRSRTQAHYAALAVADSSVISKVIEVDGALNGMEMEAQVRLDAERYIPYPLEEVSIDFEVIGPSTKSANWLEVLLIASRTENVNSRMEILARSGLKAKVVDVESLAVERACQLISPQLINKGVGQTVAIIDIGASITNITVLHNMKTIFTREEAFGGEQLTKGIQHHYGLSYSEAGLAKKTGGLPDDYTVDVLTPFKESVVLQIRRSLQFFFSMSQYSEIHQLVLAGGTAGITNLSEYVAEHIGVPTVLANPFVSMAISSRIDKAKLASEAHSLLVGCGLAMRSFDTRA